MMSILSRLIQGLSIFEPDGIFGLDLNEVAITTTRELSEQEKETLRSLGWVYCEEYNTWKFTTTKTVISGHTVRADGRIEIICKCGVGHPSKRLQETFKRPWEKHDGVHGCCGCCDDKIFSEYEEGLLEKSKPVI
jgi:hypothetical protein